MNDLLKVLVSEFESDEKGAVVVADKVLRLLEEGFPLSVARDIAYVSSLSLFLEQGVRLVVEEVVKRNNS